MSLVQHQVENELTKRLGAPVTIGQLNFSLLSGSVDVQDVTVAGQGEALPLLTVRRIRAEISMGRALKKELVFKSLAVEAPVLNIHRRDDGSTNLPARPSTTKQQSAVTDGDVGKSGKPWKIEAARVLIVDGSVHFRAESIGGREATAYSAEKISAELRTANGGLELTAVAESVTQTGVDQPNIGPVRCTGRAEGVDDLARVLDSHFAGTVSVGDHMTVNVNAGFNPLDVSVMGKGDLAVAQAIAFLPAALTRVIPAVAAGMIEVAFKAAYSQTGLTVQEFNLRAVDLRLPR